VGRKSQPAHFPLGFPRALVVDVDFCCWKKNVDGNLFCERSENTEAKQAAEEIIYSSRDIYIYIISN
jgi:hypothetical protein